MNRLLFIPICFLVFHKAQAQSGCTDTQALNYDVNAVVNDGSCVYPPTTLPSQVLCDIDSIFLEETSGIVPLGPDLWSHADGAEHTIYRIDSLSPAILQPVDVNRGGNTDWEDMTWSGDYVYIGDFGNNSGSRTNLRILRVLRSDITDTTTNVDADIINFYYVDQVDFTANHNNHPFDCEAFFFWNDSLHLFTKDWANHRTKHYIIPADTGNHAAQVVDSFDVQGLITSASIQDDGLIVLLGYSFSGGAQCFVWMLNDYEGGRFFSGNKRRFFLGSPGVVGQSEGICLRGENKGYITNEKFQQFIFNVPPQLRAFDLSPYLIQSTVAMDELTDPDEIILQQTDQRLLVSLRSEKYPDTDLIVSDSLGRILFKEKISGNNIEISTGDWPPGVYSIAVYRHGQKAFGRSIVVR